MKFSKSLNALKSLFSSIQLTVGKKLYASFVCVLIIMCLLAWVTTSELRKVNQQTTEITDSWMVGIEIINQINYYTEHVLALEMQTMLEPDKANKSKYNDEIAVTIKLIEEAFTTYEARVTSPEELDSLVKVKTFWSDYIAIHSQFVQYATKMNLTDGAGTNGPLILGLIQDSQKIYSGMKDQMGALVKLNHDGAQKAKQEAGELYERSMLTSTVLIVIAAAVAMALAYSLSRFISTPVRFVSKAMEQAASGDLSMDEIKVSNRDEIGDLVRSLNRMIQNFKGMVHSIQDASGQVAASSQQLSVGSGETSKSAKQVSVTMLEAANRAETQMRASQEASTAMEEMSAGIQRIAETTGQVSELALLTTQRAEEGNKNIMNITAQMDVLNQTVEQSARQLNQLNERSVQIGDIVTIIREIASQTGLLSLNASIEAARAGEHGRGFAVVASEVKKLAEQSNQFATQITQLIQAVRADSKQAVEAMNAGMTEIQKSTKDIHETGKSFEQILLSTENLAAQIQDIAAASEELNAGSEEISASSSEVAQLASQSFESTQHVASISKEQLAAMQEVNETTTSLSLIAERLQQLTAKFKV